MKIAFVGKGGSGKTTLAAAFCRFLQSKNTLPLLAIDADINMHLGPLLGFASRDDLHISHPETVSCIKTWLRGSNPLIKDLVHFRKTTPPSIGSNLIIINDQDNALLSRFGVRDGNLRLLTVGTYDAESIGTSCYHNDLAILENILSHLVDDDGVAIVDMVAGVDAFANTLHAQFDLLVLVVEPTKRGVEVFRQYAELARHAGIGDRLIVIGNKIRNEHDRSFLSHAIPSEFLYGFFEESPYLRQIEQDGSPMDIVELEPQNTELLSRIADRLSRVPRNHNERLKKLCELHRKYVAQGFITERFGDLSTQIDESFDLAAYIQNYGSGQKL